MGGGANGVGVVPGVVPKPGKPPAATATTHAHNEEIRSTTTPPPPPQQQHTRTCHVPGFIMDMREAKSRPPGAVVVVDGVVPGVVVVGVGTVPGVVPVGTVVPGANPGKPPKPPMPPPPIIDIALCVATNTQYIAISAQQPSAMRRTCNT